MNPPDSSRNTRESGDGPFSRHGKYPAVRRPFLGCLNEGIPGAENPTIDSFRDGFYRAMYRLLLAGALLARINMAPLFPARQTGNISFFVKLGSNYLREEVEAEDEDFYPSKADIESIRQFPVYNFDA